MTHTKDEALKLALEALKKTQAEGYNLPGTAIAEAITAIKQALAAPVQEPVAHMPADALEQLRAPRLILHNVPLYGYAGQGTIAVYTTPPAAPEKDQP